MSSGATFRQRTAACISLAVIGTCLALIEIYILEYGASYREVIVTLMVLAGFWAFAAGNRGLKVRFVFLILTFALGYRTIDVTSNLRVHPAELVLWGLLALPLLQRNRLILWLPFWLILFIPFWLWGWWPLISGDGKWDLMFSEFKNFILLIPLYFLASSVLVERSNWRPVLLAFYFVGAWIAAMGVLEYVYPDVKTWFPTFVTLPLPVETGEGFQRARFSFWGSMDAVYICVLALPIAAAVWEWWSISWKRALNILLTAVMLWGVYISGHRNAWLMVTLQFLGFAVVNKKYLLGVAVLLVFISIYQVLPDVARARIYSGTELVSGQPVASDSSGQKRWDRVTTSLNNTVTHPLGRGWTTAGWVHNDFLQVAENLGVMAGALFLGGYIFTLGQLWCRVRTASLVREQRTLGVTLLMSFACAGIILATDASLELPQLILPIWFFWVIVEIWLRQTRMKRATTDDTSFNLGALANLQLCPDRSRYAGSGQMGR
jgi:hypothetical protein